MTAPLSSQQAAWVTEHAQRVEGIARGLRHQLPHVPISDLISAGNEALVLAATRYDPGVGVPFANFAHYRIRGAMIDFVRQRTPAQRQNRRAVNLLEATQSLVEQAALANTGERRSLEVRLAAAKALVERTAAAAMMASAAPAEPDEVAHESASPETSIISEQMHQRVRAVMQGLADDDRQLVEAIYIEGMSMHGYAAKVGRNVSTISRRHSKILGDLSTHLREFRPSGPRGADPSERAAPP